MAQSTPPNASGKAGAGDDVPISKHQLKASPTQILQHNLEAQGKQLDQVGGLIEAQTKQIEELTKRAELQTKQIETLNADVNRLTAVLLARNAENAAPAVTPSVAPSHAAAAPAASEPTPVIKAEAAPAEPTPQPLAPDGSPTHVIKRGENLISVARQHGTTVSELLKLNKIEDERKLQIGQTLLLPKPAAQKPDSQ